MDEYEDLDAAVEAANTLDLTALVAAANESKALNTDEKTDSLFDDFGGYYSVLHAGVEVAKFAPSSVWTAFWRSMNNDPDWTYRWITTGR